MVYYSHTSCKVVPKNLVRDTASIPFFACVILCTDDVIFAELYLSTVGPLRCQLASVLQSPKKAKKCACNGNPIIVYYTVDELR